MKKFWLLQLVFAAIYTGDVVMYKSALGELMGVPPEFM